MLFTLEPLKASEGDCLLLHWGTKKKPKLAIIDGGPGQTYENFLSPRLDEIRAARKLATLPIELTMVSHMDSDHVIGVKKLYREYKKAVEKGHPDAKLLELKRLWHNVFNDILGDAVDAYYKTLTASVTASANGEPAQKAVDAIAAAFVKRKKLKPSEAEENAYDVALILAGHGDGRQLRDDQEYLHGKGLTASLNHPFKKGSKPTLVTAGAAAADVSGLEFLVVGPAAAEIAQLQKEFDKYIKANNLTEASVLAAYADKSIKNLSSIVCLVRAGTKSILLTGDARGDKVLEGLKAAKVLKGNKPLHVDVLKVPHHGSDRNVEAEFFEKVTADAYVLSGDGKHGNPERDTLEWIIESRDRADRYDIYLTYTVTEIDKMRKAEAKKEEKKKKAKKQKFTPWSDAKNSLKTLFESYKGYGFTLHEGAPFKIELGDEKIGW